MRLDAQIVETPVSFDSAAKVRSLTPALVARFELRPPVWPVEGDFVEARLYAVSTGGKVLSVERTNGQLERYMLAEEQVAALREAIDSGMVARTGSVVAERPTETADVSRGAFARNQMILSAAVYGPLIASFADEGETATALYLLSVGASFFVVNNVSKTTRVTSVQNGLATDGAIRGYAAASALLFAFGGENLHRKTYSALGLAGALGGSMAGFNYGRRLTDSEGQSARKASTLAAATTFGVLGATGVLESRDQERFVAAAVVAGGFAGYLIGPVYPRSARYSVTAGDVRLLPVGALIGLGAGAAPFLGIRDDSPILWTTATAGMLAGIALMDGAWVRRYDHDNVDATLIGLGTLAGGLMGGAVAILVRPIEEQGVVALLTGGSLLGAFAGQAVANPPLARGGEASNADRSVFLGTARLQFDPAALALTAGRVPGSHPILRLRF